jgi:hypothetical protein
MSQFAVTFDKKQVVGPVGRKTKNKAPGRAMHQACLLRVSTPACPVNPIPVKSFGFWHSGEEKKNLQHP